jgi:hypothetical protein
VQTGSKNDFEKLLLPSVPFKSYPIESSHGVLGHSMIYNNVSVILGDGL